MDDALLALGVTIKLPPEAAIPLAILGAGVLGLLLYAVLLINLVEAEPTPAQGVTRRIVGGLFILAAAYGLTTCFGRDTTGDRQLVGLMGVGLVIGCYVIASSPAPLVGALCLFLASGVFLAKPLLWPVTDTSTRTVTTFGPECPPEGCAEEVTEVFTFDLTSETHLYYVVPGGIAAVLGAALVFVAVARRKRRRLLGAGARAA